jgi:hypothetical protein
VNIVDPAFGSADVMAERRRRAKNHIKNLPVGIAVEETLEDLEKTTNVRLAKVGKSTG